MNTDEPRNLSAPERVERFQAWKSKIPTADSEISTCKTHWHLVDQDLTLDQIADIPEGRPGDTRTPTLWIKFRRPRLQEIVVAKGFFDYDGGTWTSRLSSVEDGDDIGRVVAMAWARIVDGERPWEGPTIPMHEADPW
jgi:hypothetical protein